MSDSTQVMASYSQNDFPNKTWNLAVLLQQIATAGLPTPTNVNPVGTVLVITFGALLTAAQMTTLDGVIAAHTGAAFGNMPVYVSSVGGSTSTSGTWVPLLTLNSGILPAATYALEWNVEVEVTAGASVACQALINSVEQSYDSWFQQDWHTYTGTVVSNLTAGSSFTAGVNAKLVGSGTASARRCWMQLFPVN